MTSSAAVKPGEKRMSTARKKAILFMIQEPPKLLDICF
jgi:hypothetical protein